MKWVDLPFVVMWGGVGGPQIEAVPGSQFFWGKNIKFFPLCLSPTALL